MPSKSKKSYKGGNGAASFSTEVYGDMANQHAVSANDNTIAMNNVQGGGGDPAAAGASVFSSATVSNTSNIFGGKKSKGKKSKGKKGGVGLGEVAVPALLVYANNAFGRGRKSVRLNPMSHFSRKSMRRKRGSKRRRGSRRR